MHTGINQGNEGWLYSGGGGKKRAKIKKGDGEKIGNGETERKERKLGPGRVVCLEGERKRERD